MLDFTRDDKGMMLLLIPLLVLVAGFSSDFGFETGQLLGLICVVLDFHPSATIALGLCRWAAIPQPCAEWNVNGTWRQCCALSASIEVFSLSLYGIRKVATGFYEVLLWVCIRSFMLRKGFVWMTDPVQPKHESQLRTVRSDPDV